MVVLIHGIMDRPYIMWKIEHHLSKTGYRILNFHYASTRWTMDSVVQHLHTEILHQSENSRQIHYVAHSLGGLVVRAYLAAHPPHVPGKVILIATPNQGSTLAECLDDIPVFEWLLGPAGQRLGKDTSDYFNSFPPPSLPFGLIAGGLGNSHGLSPLIAGDDDGVVGKSEVRLSGSRDFIQIIGTHTSLLWQNATIEQIKHFLLNAEFDHHEPP